MNGPPIRREELEEIHAEIERCLRAGEVFKLTSFLAPRGRSTGKPLRDAFRRAYGGKSPKGLYLALLAEQEQAPASGHRQRCSEHEAALRDEIEEAVSERRPFSTRAFLIARGVKSPGWVWTTFRRQVGKTPGDYYLACIIERARALRVERPAATLVGIAVLALPKGSEDRLVTKVLRLLEAEQRKAA